MNGDEPVYRFPLRADFTVSVILPKDLNIAEVERFSAWLRALVIRNTEPQFKTPKLGKTNGDF